MGSMKKNFPFPWIFLPRRALLLTLGVLLFLGITVQPARAATFDVDRTDDTATANACTTAPNDCSLRGAILAANAAAGADTINLPAGNYVLSRAGTGEDAAATGDLDITGDLTILGAGAATTIIDANGIDRVIDLIMPASGTLTITLDKVQIRNGLNPSTSFTNQEQVGGGIAIRHRSQSGIVDLTLENAILANNQTTGGAGGGLAVTKANGASPSIIHIQHTTIAGNTAGGISGGSGGGISCNGCILTMESSLVSGNTAAYSNNSLFAGGGGIYITFDNSSATLTNTTISGNVANNHGGGIAGSISTGTITLIINFTTVTNNTADNDTINGGDGGGVYAYNAGITLQNSIVQGNTDNSTAGANDCSGTLTSNNYNVVGSGTGCPVGANDSTAAALLGSLLDNGGPTLTHLPAAGSAATNRVTSGASGCTPGVSVDQRGAVRANGINRGGAHCDSGAVEGDSNQNPAAVAFNRFSAGAPTDRWPLVLAALGTLVAGLYGWRRHARSAS